ncbi:hypothetical protein DM860_014738 [Cuscuta australis]|uniref:Uncharacterized protein n=1 Tax=Cuscuta australis TaxID=267555 RepID=A0A328DL09_9ASTE|nr:hypothetical protein DM860_014738 [Cuscuta australis]
MATGLARSCVQSLLKVVNLLLGVAGIAMIMYSLWMFRVWEKHMPGRRPGPSPLPFFPPEDAPIPWYMSSSPFHVLSLFIYTILGLGITLCFITCSGHIAAETVNGCCLYIDFPDDSTGNFDVIKKFVKEHFDLCKWIGLSVVAVQGTPPSHCSVYVDVSENVGERIGALSIILSMILKALRPHRETYYDSDDDYIPDRVPLLKNYVPQTSYVVGNPVHGPNADTWNIRK